jgi:hypothetical protein
MAIWYPLWSFGVLPTHPLLVCCIKKNLATLIYNDNLLLAGVVKGLVYFVVIWCIFPVFGMLYQDKSGNPDFQ